MNEDRLRSEIARGVRAEALINDELLTEAFETLETEYVARWRNQTKPTETEAREKLWQAVKVVEYVRQHLVAAVSNGSVAQKDLDALVEKQRRILGVKVPF